MRKRVVYVLALALLALLAVTAHGTAKSDYDKGKDFGFDIAGEEKAWRQGMAANTNRACFIKNEYGVEQWDARQENPMWQGTREALGPEPRGGYPKWYVKDHSEMSRDKLRDAQSNTSISAARRALRGVSDFRSFLRGFQEAHARMLGVDFPMPNDEEDYPGK